MRRALCLLTLAATATAAEPKARLAGPASAPAGAVVRLDPAGTASDRKPILRLWKGPSPLAPEPLYNKAGALVCYEAVPAVPGDYHFVLVAVGDAPPPADPLFDFAFWTVTVAAQPAPRPAPGPDPVPRPAPEPLPEPQPQPPPAPAPAAVTVPLYAVMAYDLADPNGRALAPVRTDPGLAPALQNLGVSFHAWDYTSRAWDDLKLRPVVGVGGNAVMVIYDADGHTYGPDGAPVERVRAAFAPPATSDGVVAMFKKMRGQ